MLFGWQGYGIFLFLWLFVIPLTIFVVAYWKILAVIRRQARVAADRHRSTMSLEPVAGTSAGAAEMVKTASKKDGNQRDEVVVKGERERERERSQRERGRVGNQQGSTVLSKAQINVVRTMIYITVCFTLCWMPMYFNVLFKKLTVRRINRACK